MGFVICEHDQRGQTACHSKGLQMTRLQPSGQRGHPGDFPQSRASRAMV